MVVPAQTGLVVVAVPHARAQAQECDRIVRDHLASGAPVARIAPTPDAAAATLRRLADAGTPALGAACTTLQRWALDRWRLYGDGRTPVDAAERHAGAMAALDGAPAKLTAAGLPGMVGCVERVVRAAAGSAAFAGAAPNDDRLSPAERALLAVCRAYSRLLKERGLIEPGDALALLPQAMGPYGWVHLVVDGPRGLTDAEAALLAEAAGRRGVTVVAPLGDDPAFEAARILVARVEEACAVRGIPVAHTPCAQEPEARRAPWASAEVADLAERLFKAGGTPAIEPRGDVSFYLPAGRYAEPKLVAQAVCGLIDDGIPARSIAVACKDPLALADAVGARLAQAPGRAVACRAQGSVPVAATDLGKLLGALVALVETERACGDEPAPHLRGTASDVARNPLSGIATGRALDLDCAWRGDRSTGAGRILRDLAEAAEDTFAAMCAGEPDPGPATPPGASSTLGGWAAAMRGGLADNPWGSADARRNNPEEVPAPPASSLPDTMAGSPAGRAGEAPTAPLARAIAALRAGDLAAAADILTESQTGSGVAARRERAAGAAVARLARARASFSPGAPLTAAGFARLVAGSSVPVSWVSVAASDVAAQTIASVLDADPNAVAFSTLADLEGRSFEAVVVCDMTADDAPVGGRADAASVFLERLGVFQGPQALQQMRRRLRGAVEAARSRIVFERCLQDTEARSLRPSALFEEVVDCYRADPTATDDLDRATGMPKGVALPCVTLGEEHFAELASPTAWTPATVSSAAPNVVLPPDIARRQFFSDDRIWSPGALELYLSCPLRWFYERQLPCGRIDASFGSRELGTFSRRVLRVFHEEMAARGTARVEGARDRAVWEPVLDASFERALEEQRIGADPLVAVTRLERERLETVRRDLRACVERDALLPERFAPSRHEWSFGDREPLLYGSIRLRGTIDRIDEDGAGHALVIGYRGAFGDDHGVPRPKRGQDPAEVDPLPPHSQALIGAAALQRALPGTVAVGALYVSYNRARVRGFLDGSAADCLSGPCLDERNTVPPSPGTGGSGFQELLAYLEREVAAAMDRLRDGDVGPNPRFGASSCAYCTVTGCPKRRS